MGGSEGGLVGLLEPQLATFPRGIGLVKVSVQQTFTQVPMPCLTPIHLGVLRRSLRGRLGLCLFLAISATGWIPVTQASLCQGLDLSIRTAGGLAHYDLMSLSGFNLHIWISSFLSGID